MRRVREAKAARKEASKVAPAPVVNYQPPPPVQNTVPYQVDESVLDHSHFDSEQDDNMDQSFYGSDDGFSGDDGSVYDDYGPSEWDPVQRQALAYGSEPEDAGPDGYGMPDRSYGLQDTQLPVAPVHPATSVFARANGPVAHSNLNSAQPSAASRAPRWDYGSWVLRGGFVLLGLYLFYKQFKAMAQEISDIASEESDSEYSNDTYTVSQTTDSGPVSQIAPVGGYPIIVNRAGSRSAVYKA